MPTTLSLPTVTWPHLGSWQLACLYEGLILNYFYHKNHSFIWNQEECVCTYKCGIHLMTVDSPNDAAKNIKLHLVMCVLWFMTVMSYARNPVPVMVLSQEYSCILNYRTFPRGLLQLDLLSLPTFQRYVYASQITEFLNS